jgi:hypothetical protein
MIGFSFSGFSARVFTLNMFIQRFSFPVKPGQSFRKTASIYPENGRAGRLDSG